MSYETLQFIDLIKEDNLIGLKELWKCSYDKINIYYDGDYAFRLSCEKGYLEVAKWLWEISENTIDVHA